MIYSKSQIELLAAILKSELAVRQKLRKMLAESAPELVALEAALMGEVPPMEYLLKSHRMLAVFTSAVHKNRSALKVLLAKKEFIWAATANMTNGDENAALWLKKNHLEHFMKLAEGIMYAHDKRND